TYSAHRLVDLLAKHGRVDELRAQASAGGTYAAYRLVDLLAEEGRIDEALFRAAGASCPRRAVRRAPAGWAAGRARPGRRAAGAGRRGRHTRRTPAARSAGRGGPHR